MGHQPATHIPWSESQWEREPPPVSRTRRAKSLQVKPGTEVHHGFQVIDGSVIPRSLSVNPLLTITALAERSLLHMGEAQGLRLTV